MARKSSDGMSRSLKVATVMFTMPGKGRITVQENPSREDVALRRLIENTCERFMKEYAELKESV